MDYENYAGRIKPLRSFDYFEKPKPDSKPVVRISVKKGEMTTHTIKKIKVFSVERQEILFSKCSNIVTSWTFSFERIRWF